MGFGKQLKKALILNNLSQKEFADKVGITEAAVSRYVHGTREPRAYCLKRICAVLDITADFLLRDEIECEQCEYYDKEDDYCTAFECNGLECAPLPCENTGFKKV